MIFCVHALAGLTIGDGGRERPVTQSHVLRRREKKKTGRYLVSGARCRHGGEVRASAETSTFRAPGACAAAEVGFEGLHG